MIDLQTQFDRRITRLAHKHDLMTQGYFLRMRDDGLVVVHPRRSRRGLPVKMLVLLAVGFIGFKAFMLAAIGPAAYDERLAVLQQGSTVERAGAWVLGTDPATQMIAQMAGPILR